jgi:exodeoxyribonuclease VII large subunit
MIEPSTGKIYSITELNSIVRGLLETRLTDIWIQGEITNLAKPASGHWYFTLKDDAAQIRCAMFRNRNRCLRFKPDNGTQIQARGRVSLYEPRGDYQFIVEECEPAGEGELQRAFEQLKQRLWDEGLFEEKHKKPLPSFPQKVGVITSPSGAAIRDILNVLNRRYPLLDIIIYPVAVQGADAVPQIIEMIQYADSRQECDVLLLSRGGGSIEDLWAFNDEAVARTIFACKTPVVTGVGHEIDFTITEFVSDLRAPTPSAAAELITPLEEELQSHLEKTAQTLQSNQARRFKQAYEKLQWLKKSLQFHHPEKKIQRQAQRVDDFELRLKNSVPRMLQRYQSRSIITQHMLIQYSPAQSINATQNKQAQLQQDLLNSTQARLNSFQKQFDDVYTHLTLLSPKATLERGYSIIYDPDSGRILKQLGDLRKGMMISGQLIDGKFTALIQS